jgi:hypothetical protein
MGDVEVERSPLCDVGTPAGAATDFHVARKTSESPAEQDSQGGATRDIAVAQVGTTEPRRPRTFGGRQRRGKRANFGRRTGELAHPEGDLGARRRQRDRLAAIARARRFV